VIGRAPPEQVPEQQVGISREGHSRHQAPCDPQMQLCLYLERILPYDSLHLDRRFPQSKSLHRKTGTIACSNGVICAFRFTVIISIVVS